MTHPSYRGQGLFPLLAGSLYTRLAAEGYSAVWGFPNSQSHRGFIRDLGWLDVCEIPMLRCELASTPAAAESSSPATPRGTPDARVDRLWQKLRTRLRVTVNRRAEHVAWRIRPDSQNHYQFAALESSSEIRGYTIIKIFGNEVDLVDIEAEDLDAGRTLLGEIVAAAQASGSAAINAWLPLRHPLHGEFERRGFVLSSPVTYLGVRPLASELAELRDPHNWHYSMLDSDVY